MSTPLIEIRYDMFEVLEFIRALEGLDPDQVTNILQEVSSLALIPVQNAAKQKVVKRTRTLSRSLVIEIGQRMGHYTASATLGTNLEYAAIHEFGGVITPVRARSLRWISRDTGQPVFAQRVEIPARPYMRPAWDENVNEVQRLVVHNLRAMFTQLGLRRP